MIEGSNRVIEIEEHHGEDEQESFENQRRHTPTPPPLFVNDDDDESEDSGVVDAVAGFVRGTFVFESNHQPTERSRRSAQQRTSTTAALQRLRSHASRAVTQLSSNNNNSSNSLARTSPNSSSSTVTPPTRSMPWNLFSQSQLLTHRRQTESPHPRRSASSLSSEGDSEVEGTSIAIPSSNGASPLLQSFLARNLRSSRGLRQSPPTISSSTPASYTNSNSSTAPLATDFFSHDSGDESFRSSHRRTRVFNTVRAISRLGSLQQTKCYDITQPMLKELSQLEKWTDEADHWREAVVLSGGIRTLLDLLQTFSTQPTVLVKLCNILTYLARNGTCLRALSAHATIEGVLGAMQSHVAHASLQARACNALNNLAMREGNRIRIAKAHGIPQIIRGMKEHPLNAEVQANGCNCLWNLAIWAPNRPLIAQADGVIHILHAMEEHVNDPSLFGEGCGALWNLADHPPTRNQILNHNGIATICRAMELHRSHFVMHRLCCGALESLLNDNDLGRIQLYEQKERGIALILAVMRRRPQDEELQSAGCGILANYALGDLMQLALSSFVSTLCELDAPTLLLAAMRRHGASTKVQCRACCALSYLSYNATARQRLLDLGAVEMVRAALLEHAGEVVVFGTAVLALHQLTKNEDEAYHHHRRHPTLADGETPATTSPRRLLQMEDRAPAA